MQWSLFWDVAWLPILAIRSSPPAPPLREKWLRMDEKQFTLKFLSKMEKYSLKISSYQNVTLFKVQALLDVVDVCVTPVVEGGGDISGWKTSLLGWMPPSKASCLTRVGLYQVRRGLKSR